MTKLIIDMDFVVFKAACAVENRYIKARNNTSGEELIFKNRTEFYGRDRAKSGGWLSEQQGLSLEDFTITDEREVEPLENALFIAKNIIKDVCKKFCTEDYYGYVSGGTNFRKDICTLLPYKGNRDNLITPYHRKDVVEYLISNCNAIRTENVEADDMLVTDMHSAIKSKKNLVGVIVEKDFLGCDGNWYNYDTDTLTKVRGFGELHRNDKGDVKGSGRMWKYFQACSSDTSDNYAANCFSDKKNGPVAVFNRLGSCKNDKEAFEAMKLHFQHLYPEPKEITNWKGDTFTIDWKYVMQEMFDMCHLLRYKGDRIDIVETMNKLGVEL